MLRKVTPWRHAVVGVSIITMSALAGFRVIGGGDDAVFRPEHFDAKQVTVWPDGDDGVRVREVVDIDFGLAERRGYQRIVPNDFGEPTDITASSDANDDVSTLDLGSRTRIRVGNPAITFTGQHRYVLEYVLPDAHVSSGELALDIIGNDEEFRTDRFEVVLTGFEFGETTCDTGSSGTFGGCTLGLDGEGRYVTVIEPLEPGEGITVGGTILARTAGPSGTAARARSRGDRLLAARAVRRRARGAHVGAGVRCVTLVREQRGRRRGRRRRRRVRRPAGTAGGRSRRRRPHLPGARLPARRAGDDRVRATTGCRAVAGLGPAARTARRRHRLGVVLRDGRPGGDRARRARRRAPDGAGPEHRPPQQRRPATHRSALPFVIVGHARHLQQVVHVDVEGDPEGAAALRPALRLVEARRAERVRLPAPGLRGVVVPAVFVLFFVGGLVANLARGASGLLTSPFVAIVLSVAVVGLVAFLAYRTLLPARTATGSALALRTESFRRFLEASEGRHVEWAWKNGLLREYSAWAVALDAATAWERAVKSSNIPHPELALRGPLLVHTSSSAFRSSHTPPSSSGSGSGGGFSGGGVGGGGGGGSSGSW